MAASMQAEMLKVREAAAAELQAARSEARAEIEASLAEHLAQSRAMTAEFNKAQEVLQEQVANLHEQVRELQHRLDGRESRPEDLSTIEQLRRQVREKDDRAAHPRGDEVLQARGRTARRTSTRTWRSRASA